MRNVQPIAGSFPTLLCLVVVGWAAVDAWGWLHGLGATMAIWLLMPYGFIERRSLP